MKTVKDLTELKQLALSRGAAVELGATRFNSSGDRFEKLMRPQTPIKPEPPIKAEPKRQVTEPAPPPPATEVKVDLAPVAAAQERLGQMMAQMMSQLPQPAAPVREWLFTVERDSNGLLASIRATAQT